MLRAGACRTGAVRPLLRLRWPTLALVPAWLRLAGSPAPCCGDVRQATLVAPRPGDPMRAPAAVTLPHTFWPSADQCCTGLPCSCTGIPYRYGAVRSVYAMAWPNRVLPLHPACAAPCSTRHRHAPSYTAHSYTAPCEVNSHASQAASLLQHGQVGRRPRHGLARAARAHAPRAVHQRRDLRQVVAHHQQRALLLWARATREPAACLRTADLLPPPPP